MAMLTGLAASHRDWLRPPELYASSSGPREGGKRSESTVAPHEHQLPWERMVTAYLWRMATNSASMVLLMPHKSATEPRLTCNGSLYFPAT